MVGLRFPGCIAVVGGIMSEVTDRETIASLIELHRGLTRLGPGDDGFTRAILKSLPPLPREPRIADLGCGTGAGALLLAEFFRSKVTAVDSAPGFLKDLEANADRAGLGPLIVPLRADIGSLDWPAGSIDLLWSEGAACNLGFEEALTAWRPLLSKDGVAVVADMSWFAPARPQPVVAWLESLYPSMGSEEENVERAQRAGFEVMFTRRLPAEAWWKNYYGPLRQRMEEIGPAGPMEAVMHETRGEMAMFERYSDSYGYVFYVLKAQRG